MNRCRCGLLLLLLLVHGAAVPPEVSVAVWVCFLSPVISCPVPSMLVTAPTRPPVFRSSSCHKMERDAHEKPQDETWETKVNAEYRQKLPSEWNETHPRRGCTPFGQCWFANVRGPLCGQLNYPQWLSSAIFWGFTFRPSTAYVFLTKCFSRHTRGTRSKANVCTMPARGRKFWDTARYFVR